MRITEKYDDGSDDCYDRASYELNVYSDAGKCIGGCDVSDNLSECPEDATLNRDLSFALDIVDLMKAAWLAGKNGEDFIVEEVDES